MLFLLCLHCSDDHSILKWNVLADEVLTVAKLPQDVYCTDIHWYPAAAVGTKKQSVQSELFVLACTDGKCARVHVYYTLQIGCHKESGTVHLVVALYKHVDNQLTFNLSYLLTS